jgi:hypothetical protein
MDCCTNIRTDSGLYIGPRLARDRNDTMFEAIKRYATLMMIKAPNRRPSRTTWLSDPRKFNEGHLIEGMYWRSEGKLSKEKEFVKLVIRFENRYVRSDLCEPLSLFGSSTSICCISCRRESIDALSRPSRDGKSRLDRADSTVGGSYLLADDGSFRLEYRSSPCLSASSLISSGPTRDWEGLGRDDVASS